MKELIISNLDRTTIYLGGGLGNQIFQFAFAHYSAIQLDKCTNVVKIQGSNKLPHEAINLIEMVETCRHCSLYSICDSSRLSENPWSRRVSRFSLFGILDYRNDPFIDSVSPKRVKKSQVIVGYFQNKNFILPNEKLLENELKSSLSRESFELAVESHDLEVIHIRGNDIKTRENRLKIGLLDENYYKRVLSKKTNLTRVVVTDDLEYARALLSKFSVDVYLDNHDLNVFETLKIMGLSTRLIASNSSLSWWGGFLARITSAEVIIPNPFFRSSSLKSKDALNYPGFLQVESTFKS